MKLVICDHKILWPPFIIDHNLKYQWSFFTLKKTHILQPPVINDQKLMEQKDGRNHLWTNVLKAIT